MADVNKLLPDVGDIDTSITINNDMSLEKIANQYGGLGNDINRFGNAAAEDVHQRQVKLIGNDFGPVNPMMYGAYYQPSINDAESTMRVKGTQKALEEGMDRGKKAAEANLANAKASYQKSIDAYNNAKQAFSEAQVAILPNIDTGTWENVTGSNTQAFQDFINDPAKAKDKAITSYTDQVAASRDPENFWNSKGAWDIAKNNVRKETGKNISDEEFRNNYDYGQAVTRAYIEEYFSSRGETNNLEKFRSSYNYMKKAVNDVADYISGVIENPEFLVNKQLIREGKKIEGYDNQFIADFWSGTDFNNIFGFSVMDMHELVRWKNENPQQFKEYNEQLAQATGMSQTTEIADGERWYLMPDGQYKQLQKGTPVFFAYPGSMNADGTYNDKDLEKFIKMYRDYYKTDISKISGDELTNRQEALNDAYKEYMKHVAGIIRFEQAFDRTAGADEYNTILACFDNVAKSQYMIYGHTAEEWVNSFKEGIKSNPRTAAAYFQELAAVAYEHNPDIFRYNPQLGQVVTESMYYDDDSVAPNENKLASRAFEDQAIREAVRKLPPERATAEFLLYSRSMELYNDGATNDNINPAFLNNKLRDFSNQVFKDLYSNFVSVPASLINFTVGTVGGFLTTGQSQGLETDIFNNNMSMKDVWGGLIDPSYGTEGHPNSLLGKAMIQGDIDSNAKKYAMSLVNPLFVDVITGDKEWNELTGIAQQYSSEAPDFLSKTNIEYMGMRMASIVMSGYAQGAAIKGVGAAKNALMTSKMADRVRLAAMPHIVNWTSNSTIASKLSVIPEEVVGVENGQSAIRGAALSVYADDPLMVAQAEARRVATQATNATADLTALNATNKVDDLVAGVKAAGGRAAKSADKLDDVYGVLTRNAVHGLTSMGADNIDDLIKNYGSLIEKSKQANAAYKAAAEAVPKVTLKSGEVVSLADATLVTQANRVLGVSTLNMMTGIPSVELARLPDEYRNLLTKVANRMTATSDATNYSGNLNTFLKSLTPDDFKAFAQETVKRAAINADLGRGFEKLDLYRIAAAVGWEKSGVKALAKEFLTDALTDPLRDLYMNVRNPEFTMEGKYHVQTLQEYFTDPWNLAFNLGFSTGHFALSRLKNQAGATLYSHWANQARAELNATGERTAEEAKKSFQKAFDLQNKAQQFADNAWKSGMNFNKAQELVAKSNAMVHTSVEQIFKANGIDVRYGGDNLHLDNKEAFVDYINNKKLAPQEGLYILANGLNLTATNNYYLNKMAVGTGVGEFGNLDSNTYLKVYRTMANTAAKYKDVVRSTDKDAIKKINKVYDRIEADVLKANNKGEYGLKIRNLEKSLDYIFGNLKSAAKSGLEDGTLKNVRLGYLPIGSLTYAGSYDDMVNSHTIAPSRGLAYEGGVINAAALNPSEARDMLQFEDILTAMEKGEKTIDVNGETRQLDYDGLNPLDMLSVYQNNYNVHKYLDPLVGDSRLKFGDAALKNYNAYIVATAEDITKARNLDIKNARDKITGYKFKDADGKTVYHKGWLDKINDAAKEKGDDISKEINSLKSAKGIDAALTQDVKDKVNKTTEKLTNARNKKVAAQNVIDNGGIPDSGYVFIAELFGKFVNGKGDPAEGKKLFDNGKLIATQLIDAYSKGIINENNYKDGFSIDAEFNGKVYKKNLSIDSDTYKAIKNAYELGAPDADICIRAAIMSDLTTPVNPKTNKTVKGYTSRLRELQTSENRPTATPVLLGDEAFVKSTTSNSVEYYQQNWSVEVVRAYPNKVFLFGDNVLDAKSKFKPKSTQAVIRGEPNAIGIPTKRNRYTTPGSYFNDAEFNKFKAGVDKAMSDARKAIADGKIVVIPANGIGTGAARLQQTAPRCFEYLQTELERLEHTNNSKLSNATGIVKAKKNEPRTVAVANLVVSEGLILNVSSPKARQDFINTMVTRYKTNELGAVTSKESNYAKLQTFAENMTYKGFGKTSKDSQIKRITESIVDRTRTELGSSKDGFDGFDFFQKLDAIAPDKDIVDTLINRKVSSSQNMLAALKGIDEDGSVELFIEQLDKFKHNVAAGLYDDILTDMGMKREDFYNKVQDAYEVMAWATEYSNKPTSMEDAPVRFGEDGEELEIDEAGEYGTRDITGALESDTMTGRFSTTELDLNKTNMTRRVNSLGDILEIYLNDKSKLNKYVRSAELDKLYSGRIEASKSTKGLYEELVKRGKALYDSGKSSAYIRAVDDATVDITNRIKASGHTPTDEQLEAAYAEALGVTSPDTRLNQIVSKKGQTSRNYNAAKLAEAEGVVDKTTSEGWTEKVNKMRLDAGTYGGYAKQLTEGIQNLITFAGSDKAYADLLEKATDVYIGMDSVLNTKRSDSIDNFENSLIAMMGDVYDPKSMVKQMNGPEMLEYGTRVKRMFTSTIETGLYGERISKAARFEGFPKTNIKLLGNYPLYDNMDDFKLYTELFVADKQRDGLKAGPERDEATFRYLALVDEAYRNYLEKKPEASRTMTKTEFMHNMEGTYDRFTDALEAHNELKQDYNNTIERIPTPSQERGKKSLYPEGVLNFIGGQELKPETFKDDMKVTISNNEYRIEPDYGTGNEFSETGLGFTLIDKDGSNHVFSDEFRNADNKESIADKINEQFEENDHNVRIVKNSEVDANPNYGEVVQTLDEEWSIVNLNDNFLGFDTDTRDLINTARAGGYEKSQSDIMIDALFRYAESTKDSSPANDVANAKKTISKASKAEESANKQLDSIKNEATNGINTIDSYAKKYLDRHEYSQYRDDMDAYKNIKTANTEDDYYRSRVGEYTLINGGEIPKGHVTLGSILALLGYDKKSFNSDISEGRKYTPEELAADKKAHKAMQKKVNENLRKGNVVYKKVEQFNIPGELDLKSRTMTINNLLAFASQAQKKSGLKALDPESIIVSKEYADLLFRVSREGINGDNMMSKLKTTAFRITDWNKFVQDFQLAGGVSYVNALTIAQIRGAMLSNPKLIPTYIRLATDFKDDAAVAKFVVENSERLAQIAMKTGDTTILTDFQASASSRPGYSDGGTVSSFIARVIDANKNRKATERTSDEKYDFARDTINDAKDALFGDATFQRTIPVLRAKMMIMNYDKAYKMLQKKFKNITTDELEDAASKFAYAKTTAFFEPNKTQSGFFRSKGINDMLDNVQTQTQRDLLASWIGAKDEISIGQMAGNCFFALGYKNRMIQSVLQGVRSIVSPVELIQRRNVRGTFDDAAGTIKLGINSTLDDLGTQFMQSGNRQQIRSIAFLAVTAFVSAKALGLATAWDDLNFEDETQTDKNGNPQFKIPEILTKFQTIGQIWIPNAIDQEGHPYIDPKKKAFKIDTLSSIFTLPNTAWKTIDRITDPEAYYSAPQRGLPFIGVNNPINQFINADIPRAIGDELIGSNLLSPYKAMYEVLVDSSYYGNNIWEKKYLKDGSVNKNYDPLRNIRASIYHVLGFDSLLSPRGYNDYVKGYYDNPNYKSQDQLGTVTGSGIFQHEYTNALIAFMNDDMWGGLVEAGELPIKSQRLSSTARTELNTKVKNAIAQYMSDYKDAIANTTNLDAKDRAYENAVKRSADTLQAWSKKYGYVLGKDQSLLPYATRMLMAMLAGEYDDNLDYVQNTYWKASEIAQIEATGAAGYWLDDSDIEAWIAEGKTPEEFAAEKNKRSDAYNRALDEEYKARKALHDAGIDSEYLAGLSLANIRAEQRQINREVYNGALQKMKSPIGEFKNFSEMKKYYEAQIDAAGSTKQKAKLAKTYNDYVTDALAPYIKKYGEGIIADGYYNNEYLANALAEYIIIPADEYYSGKTPRASYLKDLFHVGYRDGTKLPSDKEVIAGYEQARREMQKGYSASSASILDSLIEAIKKGRLYVSDRDYSKIVKMKAYLSSKSN